MPGKDAPAHQALYDGALAGALASKYHCTTQQDGLTINKVNNCSMVTYGTSRICQLLRSINTYELGILTTGYTAYGTSGMIPYLPQTIF